MFVKNVFNYNLYVGESALLQTFSPCLKERLKKTKQKKKNKTKKQKNEKVQVLSKDINKILYKHDRQCLLNLNLA